MKIQNKSKVRIVPAKPAVDPKVSDRNLSSMIGETRYFVGDVKPSLRRFLFRRIPKYEKSLNKETHALYKYYCIDNGLRSAVLLTKSGDEGKLLENTVLLQLLRNASATTSITYYKGKKECDFVRSEREQAVELIQVCRTLEDPETLKREVSGLVEASAVTGCRDLKIITRDEEREIIHGDLRIRVIPVWRWLLETRSAPESVNALGDTDLFEEPL